MSYNRTLTFQKSWFYLFQWKPFKNDENCFLFHLKSFFHSYVIRIFYKISLIRKLRLIPKSTTTKQGSKSLQSRYCPISQEVKVIRRCNLLNNRMMSEMFFFKFHTENKAVRPVSYLFCFLKKALNEVLASSQHLSFNIFW